jgi:hypothetical protein
MARRANVKAGKVAPAGELFAEMLDDPEKNAARDENYLLKNRM